MRARCTLRSTESNPWDEDLLSLALCRSSSVGSLDTGPSVGVLSRDQWSLLMDKICTRSPVPFQRPAPAVRCAGFGVTREIGAGGRLLPNLPPLDGLKFHTKPCLPCHQAPHVRCAGLSVTLETGAGGSGVNGLVSFLLCPHLIDVPKYWCI